MLVKRTTYHGANDLITVFRPCKVDEIVGQEINKRLLSKGLCNNSLPHSLLFTGPPGAGKTTAARIVALGLNCTKTEKSTIDPCLECDVCKSILNYSNIDVMEINVGKSGGKDAVTKVINDLPFGANFSRSKVIIFDEAQQLTSAAQDLLLKEIEDGYEHVYFIFCTNEPEKLKPTLLDRTTSMHFGSISDENISDLLKNICEFEGIIPDDNVLNYIIELSKGIPRKAIKSLKKVIDEDSWGISEVKNLLSNELIDEEDPNIIDIYKCLSRGSFKDSLSTLKKLKNIHEDQIRMAVAGCFTNRLKGAKSYSQGDKFSAVLDIITQPIYQTGKPAHHVLVNYFYKVSKIMGIK